MSAKRILFICGGETVFVNPENILYIQSDRECVIVHLLQDDSTDIWKEESFIMKKSLTQVEKALCCFGFCRVHKSFVVSLSHITKIICGKIQMQGLQGTLIPIGRAYMDNLYSWLKENCAAEI